MAGIQRIGNVFYNVIDMDAAVAFYRDVLGLTLKFQDGAHWAAFDCGGVTLALNGDGPDAPGPGGATVSLRVDGLDALVTDLRGKGAALDPEIQTGAHERKIGVRDPSGNSLVLYEPLAR